MIMTENGKIGLEFRPKVTLKLATSLDGKIATRTGASKWITGEAARRRVHEMRATHDCVLTGIGTVLADDPELTARILPAPKHQPIRAVLDTRARTPNTSKLLNTAHLGTVCLFHGHEIGETKSAAICHQVRSGPTGLDLAAVLEILAVKHKVRSVMVEAGAKIAGSFLRAALVDQIVWFRAPLIIGGDGLSVFGEMGVDTLSQALAFECVDITRAEQDSVETYTRTQKH